MTVITCPDAHLLLRLATGRLDVAAAAPVEQHLSECSECLARLAVLPVDDPLLRDARGWAENGTRIVETPVVEQLMRELRQWPVGSDWQPPSVFWYNALERGRPAPATPAAPPGRRLPRAGRYRLVRLLGAGGMGKVYLAEDPELNRPVAIKFPRAAPCESWDLDRFRREACLAAKVSHPNVCPIYDIGVDEDGRFVVMAYVEGRSLADRLRATPRFADCRLAVTLALQVADGLAAIHAKQIIHRDLKPGNILLDTEGMPLIADFGLARGYNPLLAVADEKDAVGTPAYMAPEQLDSRLGPVSERTDVYSLCVVLYQLTTGQLPFSDPMPYRLLEQVVNEAPPPPRSLRPELDGGLEAVIMRGMARLPGDRYASAAELRRAAPLAARAQRQTADGNRAAPSPGQVPATAYQAALADCASAGVLLLLALGLASSRQERDTRTVLTPAVPQIQGVVLKKDDPDLELPFTHSGALPVGKDEGIRLRLQLDRAAYVYVIWIDASGAAHPVHPWKDKEDWQSLERRAPQAVVSVPEPPQSYYLPKCRTPGMDTILFLACDKPVERSYAFAAKLAGLPSLSAPNQSQVYNFYNWQLTAANGRPPDPATVNDKCLEQQRMLAMRLGADFTSSWAISYPVSGE